MFYCDGVRVIVILVVKVGDLGEHGSSVSFCSKLLELKTDKNRWLWSELKRIWGIYNDGPYQKSCKMIADHVPYYAMMFIMCREPDEIIRFVNDFDAVTVLIERNGVKIPDNDSDKGVYDYGYDYVIENNGTVNDLKEAARNFVYIFVKDEKFC